MGRDKASTHSLRHHGALSALAMSMVRPPFNSTHAFLQA